MRILIKYVIIMSTENIQIFESMDKLVELVTHHCPVGVIKLLGLTTYVSMIKIQVSSGEIKPRKKI